MKGPNKDLKETDYPIKLTLSELDQETVGLKKVLSVLDSQHENYAE